MRSILGVCIVVGLSTAAVGGERNGLKAIAAGDMKTAERELQAEMRMFPGRPELMLNLAAVYGRTDRAAAARDLYRNVLDQPAIDMKMPSGAVVSSHDIADRGLARLDPPRFATR